MDPGSIEDLKLPQAVISRLIKEALPPGVNVSKEAKAAIARSAAVFVLHATSYATENARDSRRKNVTASDVLQAVKVLQCDEIEQPVAEAVKMFKAQRDERQQQRKRNKDQPPANGGGGGEGDDASTGGVTAAGEGEGAEQRSDEEEDEQRMEDDEVGGGGRPFL